MTRLLTGEFSTQTDAGQAVEELIRAGIRREEIYVETEPATPTGAAVAARTVAVAERERRIAGAATGMLVGGLFCMAGGLLLATISDILTTLGAGPGRLGWPFGSSLWSGVLGLGVGLGLGYWVGTAIDRCRMRCPGPGR